MQKTFLITVLLIGHTLYAQFRYTSANAHSHNDYEQPAPFRTAYAEGFGSVEADIFLQNDSLLVAHEKNGLSLHRTLEKLYILPIEECIKKNGGYVFADKKRTLQLLIDIKTEAGPTLNKLIELLKNHPSLISNPSIKWVISGNRPDENKFKDYPPFILFDGQLSHQYKSDALKKIALMSDNIASYVHSTNPTAAEWGKLNQQIKQMHDLKKPVRFWGTPDNIEVWEQLMSLGVDFINTDHINALAAFLRGDTIATEGRPLPVWKKGYLDLHHINTGRGNAAYYIFPDGTNMLFDAGEEDATEPRTISARNSTIHPDNTKLPYEWISYYIKQVTPSSDIHLDYAAISHFHDDHFGSWYPKAPVSKNGPYVLTGISGVGELIPIRQLLDRGYPDYTIPVPFEKTHNRMNEEDDKYIKTINNYLSFIKAKPSGMVTGQFKSGTKNQICLVHDAKQFPEFFVQNVKSNGNIWNRKRFFNLSAFPSY
ncbi:MAG: hypothetical protein QM764_12965 [Chitinophagaceae bacterium]